MPLKQRSYKRYLLGSMPESHQGKGCSQRAHEPGAPVGRPGPERPGPSLVAGAPGFQGLSMFWGPRKLSANLLGSGARTGVVGVVGLSARGCLLASSPARGMMKLCRSPETCIVCRPCTSCSKVVGLSEGVGACVAPGEAGCRRAAWMHLLAPRIQRQGPGERLGAQGRARVPGGAL